MNTITPSKAERLATGKAIISQYETSVETVLIEGKEIKVSSLVEQITAPLAPFIKSIVTKGLSITTSHKGKTTKIDCFTKASFRKILDALLVNQRNKGGLMRGITRNLNYSRGNNKNTTFQKRRTAEYHFGTGASW